MSHEDIQMMYWITYGVTNNIALQMMHLLCPHHVGHHVGLDVHDMPGYPRTTTLQKGNCVTIEP